MVVVGVGSQQRIIVELFFLGFFFFFHLLFLIFWIDFFSFIIFCSFEGSGVRSSDQLCFLLLISLCRFYWDEDGQHLDYIIMSYCWFSSCHSRLQNWYNIYINNVVSQWSLWQGSIGTILGKFKKLGF